MRYAKVLFAVFIGFMVVVLIAFRGSMNPDRWAAYFILDVACICQMLYGPMSATRRRKSNDILVFRPQGRIQ